MGYKVKFIYPDGTIEVEDTVYDTLKEAEWSAEDGVLGFATGAEILEERGESFIEGTLKYEVIEV